MNIKGQVAVITGARSGTSEDVHQLYVSVGREALVNAVAKLPKI